MNWCKTCKGYGEVLDGLGSIQRCDDCAPPSPPDMAARIRELEQSAAEAKALLDEAIEALREAEDIAEALNATAGFSTSPRTWKGVSFDDVRIRFNRVRARLTAAQGERP